MKAKKMREYLRQRQLWWDKLSQRDKAASTRPGSVKVK